MDRKSVYDARHACTITVTSILLTQKKMLNEKKSKVQD